MGPKPLGWMIVDSLDTLMIMDCPEEVSRAEIGSRMIWITL